MQNQNTKQTAPAQKPILPQVRYHPSIQTARSRVTPTNGTQRTGPDATRCPQTRTNPEVVQNQDITNSTAHAVRPDPDGGQRPDPDPPQKPRRAPPRPELPPEAVQNQDTTNRTIPAVRPDPDGGQRPDPDPPQKPRRAPPRPELASETVQNQDTTNRTIPAVRPDPVGGQRPDPDPSQKPRRGPPRPQPAPVGFGVQMDRGLVENVEVLTRGQRTNPDWFAWRKNRITASVAHSIAHCLFVNGKSTTPPCSYLAAVTGEGPRVQTRAMSWGVEMEAEAVRRYQELKTSALGRSVSVLDCGLFIDPQRPWLAASPDGIVIDSQTNQRLLCLEVKCPYKHRDRRVEDACRDDASFCLQIQDEDGRKAGEPPSYRLKTSHSYYTQIQCQLAVTGLKKADLVVFTLKETAVVPVAFDPELWEETVSKLEVFYKDVVLPHVRQRTRETAAAWTPEQ